MNSQSPAPPAQTPPAKTPLHQLHVELGARMVPFAGFEMPLQYSAGILSEHNHTRAQAGLFDVSHMGQLRLAGDGAAGALERLVPGDILSLAPGQMRYTLLTNDDGGIIDDLMVTRGDQGLYLVINASRREVGLAHLRDNLGGIEIELLDDRALLALQGPAAARVLERHAPGISGLGFMTAAAFAIGSARPWISRSGYTGEDGFEISVAAAEAEALARLLLAEEEVAAAGLGARDSLRLEAGLCLYGNDIDETTTPVEAGLTWTIAKRRRAAGGFPGADIIMAEMAEGPRRRRVGLKPEGRAPARQHTPILDDQGETIGEVTSGGFGPTAAGPVAMGYVPARFAAPDTRVGLMVRGVARPAVVTRLPFVAHRYVRAGS